MILLPYTWGYVCVLSVLICLYTIIYGFYREAIGKRVATHSLFHCLIVYCIYAIITILGYFLWQEAFPALWICLLMPVAGLIFYGFVSWRKWLGLGLFFVLLVSLRVISFHIECRGQGPVEGERMEVLARRDYLISRLVRSPKEVLKAMPAAIGPQFQGEWALYSCSMLSAALVNISSLYPDTQEDNLRYIDSLIQVVLSPELRAYDKQRWAEDPLESLDGDLSHVSYLSHLAWMMGGYRAAGGDGRYDEWHFMLCEAMNRRLLESECMNLPTYPGEVIYVPDMLVAIIALAQYSLLHDARYSSTVQKWLSLAKGQWVDERTGLLVSFLREDGTQIENAPVKGSYTALNISYLTYLDVDFAQEQYLIFRDLFWKDAAISGFKEYHDSDNFWGMDIDAGPVVFGLSPSGTAFSLGAVSYFGDDVLRSEILRTAELAGYTLRRAGTRHYALAELALVGEAIMLCMRTRRSL